MSVEVPAPFWRRYAAWSLDFVALACLATLLAWPHLLAGWRDAAQSMHLLSGLFARVLDDGLLRGVAPAALAQQLLADRQVLAAAAALQSAIARVALSWLLAYAVLAAPYHIGFERSAWRGSPGKHALHLHVAASGGARASLPRLVVRHFAGALSWLTFNLGHALALVPPRRRALHDIVAGLQVDSTTTAPLPGWARAWLALQVVATVAFAAWGLRRYVAALQANLG
jgi:uncharacterized RDD family membrane protein YckC